MRLAFNFAISVGNGDMEDSASQRVRIYDWWINAGAVGDVFYPQAVAVGSWSGHRQWAEGCVMVGAHARCTLAEAEYMANPGSTFTKYIAVRRWYVFALNYTTGIQYRVVKKASDMEAPWYYLCVGPPQLYPNIPSCTY